MIVIIDNVSREFFSHIYIRENKKIGSGVRNGRYKE